MPPIYQIIEDFFPAWCLCPKCSNKNKSAITGNRHVGGIVGYCNGNIEKSFNAGTIEATGYNANDNSVVGGIAGSFGLDQTVKISDCYNVGNVKAAKKYAGGIIGTCKKVATDGQFIRTLERCYSIGNITSGMNGTNIGTLIGWASYTNLNLCFSDDVGPLILQESGAINKKDCAKYAKSYFSKPATDSSSVIYKLNSSTQKNWLQNSNINSGYPYLKDNAP